MQEDEYCKQGPFGILTSQKMLPVIESEEMGGNTHELVINCLSPFKLVKDH